MKIGTKAIGNIISGGIKMKDQKLHDGMQLFARKVVEQAQECFDVTLDYSEESLEDVNRILGYLYEANCINPPTGDEVTVSTVIFGAYLGEVFRRNVGGDWVNENLTGSEEFIVVRMDDTILMPIAIASKILSEGPGEDLNLRDLALDDKYFPRVN